LMGRSASHITLECALQTRPNIAIIGEEVSAKKATLEQITNEIADVVSKRAADGKNYGVVLLPEGLIEFVPEVAVLISELNELLAQNVHHDQIHNRLSDKSKTVFDFLPKNIREELMFDRDPHGNVQVSKIETEKLFVHLVETELKKRKVAGRYKGKFAALTHFFGYEGRCSLPSNFDTNYCYALGRTAAALLEHGLTGYITVVKNLAAPANEWKAGGIPLTSMMNVERRKGHNKPVIKKALVELDGTAFKVFANDRAKWAETDHYRNPGPMQYFGIIADQPNITLELEHPVAPRLVAKL